MWHIKTFIFYVSNQASEICHFIVLLRQTVFINIIYLLIVKRLCMLSDSPNMWYIACFSLCTDL